MKKLLMAVFIFICVPAFAQEAPPRNLSEKTLNTVSVCYKILNLNDFTLVKDYQGNVIDYATPCLPSKPWEANIPPVFVNGKEVMDIAFPAFEQYKKEDEVATITRFLTIEQMPTSFESVSLYYLARAKDVPDVYTKIEHPAKKFKKTPEVIVMALIIILGSVGLLFFFSTTRRD